MFTAAVASVAVCVAWGFVYFGSSSIEANAPVSVEISASGFAYTKPVVVPSDAGIEFRGESLASSAVVAEVKQPFDVLSNISKSDALEIDLFPESGVKSIHDAFPELSSNMMIEGDGDSVVLVYIGPFSKDAATRFSVKYYKPKFADESRQWNVILSAFDNVDSAKSYAKSCAEYLRSSRITWAYRDDVIDGRFVKLRFFNLSEAQNLAVRNFIEKKYSSNIPVLIRASKLTKVGS